MNDYMYQTDHNFTIKKENINAAEAALKAKIASNEIKTYIDAKRALDASELKATMAYCRWDIYADKDGNINSIYFNGTYTGDDYEILKAIAPYVEAESFIEMRGKGNHKWRWYFNGYTVIKEDCKTIFD